MMEDGILVVLLSVMILLAAAQILLRNVFDIGLFWGGSDPSHPRVVGGLDGGSGR